ncbi:MAG: VOC family protein [Planctomycetota bacterium]|nr:VOC family protein [Planctomycetota bacterium]
MNHAPLPRIDHLVFACSDLEVGVELIAELLGVGPVPGGRHPAWGTRNAVLSLGDRCYLEVIAPDPQADHPGVHTPEVFRAPDPGTLTTWAAGVHHLQAGRDPDGTVDPATGGLQHGTRQRPDGTTLRWSLTDPTQHSEAGTVPFLIDWGDSPHPADQLPPACTLEALRLEHPDPEHLESVLARLRLCHLVELSRAPHPRVRATIRSPRGTVRL